MTDRKSVCTECGKPSVYAQKRCKSCYRVALEAGVIERVSRRAVRPVRDRLLSKIEKGESGCWLFTGFLNDGGYGVMADAQARTRPAHRLAYEAFVGPIPEGLQLDHLCHTRDTKCRGGATCPHRRCVNPAHLEPVTQRENTLRGVSFSAVNATKTHCDKGHEYTPENTYQRTPTHRVCRICNNAAYRSYYRRKHPHQKDPS